tara:strand:- start:5 stop:445 length:441 start_codon:yes stop_codon:yes gene_type:complete
MTFIKHTIKITIIMMILFGVITPSFAALKHQEATLNYKKLVLEIADTAPKRQKGLMGRQQLKKDHGMLFIWKNEATRCFWMKSTPIDLDIAFLNDHYQITSIESLTANSKETTCSQHVSRYAIEMPKGWFKKNNIQVGDRLNYNAE